MRALLTLTALIGSTTITMAAGDYVLIHAIDNDETIIAKDLTQAECRKLKEDLIRKGVIKVEGREEDPNLGSMACLHKSDF